MNEQHPHNDDTNHNPDKTPSRPTFGSRLKNFARENITGVAAINDRTKPVIDLFKPLEHPKHDHHNSEPLKPAPDPVVEAANAAMAGRAFWDDDDFEANRNAALNPESHEESNEHGGDTSTPTNSSRAELVDHPVRGASLSEPAPVAPTIPHPAPEGARKVELSTPATSEKKRGLFSRFTRANAAVVRGEPIPSIAMPVTPELPIEAPATSTDRVVLSPEEQTEFEVLKRLTEDEKKALLETPGLTTENKRYYSMLTPTDRQRYLERKNAEYKAKRETQVMRAVRTEDELTQATPEGELTPENEAVVTDIFNDIAEDIGELPVNTALRVGEVTNQIVADANAQLAPEAIQAQAAQRLDAAVQAGTVPAAEAPKLKRGIRKWLSDAAERGKGNNQSTRLEDERRRKAEDAARIVERSRQFSKNAIDQVSPTVTSGLKKVFLGLGMVIAGPAVSVVGAGEVVGRGLDATYNAGRAITARGAAEINRLADAPLAVGQAVGTSKDVVVGTGKKVAAEVITGAARRALGTPEMQGLVNEITGQARQENAQLRQDMQAMAANLERLTALMLAREEAEAEKDRLAAERAATRKAKRDSKKSSTT